ncbi:hypothetical protein HZS_3252 [Henneguya salminicola]|nr:hypothetical protein HZS_3252 [Henneguya salminicola]
MKKYSNYGCHNLIHFKEILCFLLASDNEIGKSNSSILIMGCLFVHTTSKYSKDSVFRLNDIQKSLFSSIIAEFRSCLQNRLNSYELPLDETHNTENFLLSLFDLIQIFLLSDTGKNYILLLENLACFSMIEWFRNKYNKSLVQNQSDLTLKFEEILFWKTVQLLTIIFNRYMGGCVVVVLNKQQACCICILII